MDIMQYCAQFFLKVVPDLQYAPCKIAWSVLPSIPFSSLQQREMIFLSLPFPLKSNSVIVTLRNLPPFFISAKNWYYKKGIIDGVRGLEKMNKRKFNFVIAFFIVILSGCAHVPIIREKLYCPSSSVRFKQAGCVPCKAKHCPVPSITIWIPGTRLMPTLFFKRFLFRPECMIKAIDFDKQYHLRLIADTLIENAPDMFSAQHFYLFGWSGNLNFKARQEAAYDLYDQIVHITKDFKSHYGCEPYLRIITHSHGGNVALNLAKIHKDERFTIDELILLACPVQQETEQYVHDPLFKEVFALYSSFDLLQVVDPQGIYDHHGNWPLFSGRRFACDDKLIQAKIKIDGRALFHADFLRLKFVSLLPIIIDKLRAIKNDASNARNADQKYERVLSMYT